MVSLGCDRAINNVLPDKEKGKRGERSFVRVSGSYETPALLKVYDVVMELLLLGM